MATIIRNAGPIFTDVDMVQSEVFAQEYWGDLTNERMFVLPFWQVSRMLGISSSNEIALRVVNIQNPDEVSGNWMVFEQFIADTLNDPVEMGVYYFVLNDTLFNGPVLTTNPVTQLDGIKDVNSSPENNVLRIRLGKEPGTENYYAFFLAAACSIIGDGGGNIGALSGAKVPSE